MGREFPLRVPCPGLPEPRFSLNLYLSLFFFFHELGSLGPLFSCGTQGLAKSTLLSNRFSPRLPSQPRLPSHSPPPPVHFSIHFIGAVSPQQSPSNLLSSRQYRSSSRSRSSAPSGICFNMAANSTSTSTVQSIISLLYPAILSHQRHSSPLPPAHHGRPVNFGQSW